MSKLDVSTTDSNGRLKFFRVMEQLDTTQMMTKNNIVYSKNNQYYPIKESQVLNDKIIRQSVLSVKEY